MSVHKSFKSKDMDSPVTFDLDGQTFKTARRLSFATLAEAASINSGNEAEAVEGFQELFRKLIDAGDHERFFELLMGPNSPSFEAVQELAEWLPEQFNAQELPTEPPQESSGSVAGDGGTTEGASSAIS